MKDILESDWFFAACPIFHQTEARATHFCLFEASDRDFIIIPYSSKRFSDAADDVW